MNNKKDKLLSIISICVVILIAVITAYSHLIDYVSAKNLEVENRIMLKLISIEQKQISIEKKIDSMLLKRFK